LAAVITGSRRIDLKFVFRKKRLTFLKFPYPLPADKEKPLMSSDILQPVYVKKLSELLLDNVSDAIISADENFRIKTWNKAAEKIYGLSLLFSKK
jgi:PAS domain-containing protein